MDIYKSFSINIGTVNDKKDPEMIKFVLDYLKTKTMCKHAIENYLP